MEIVQKEREIVKERFKAKQMKQLADVEKKPLLQKCRPVTNKHAMRMLDIQHCKGRKQAAMQAMHH